VIFKFKFEIGQKVFQVRNMEKLSYAKCGTCKGEGRLKIENMDFHKHNAMCIDCDGKGSWAVQKKREWYIQDRTLAIGQARVEITDTEHSNHGTKPPINEQYMCHETGVFSGTLHQASALFATRESAEQFCNEQNARIEWEDISKAKELGVL
jgi:hypothetical protein